MFSVIYKVQFSDTDPGGIVFFANYFKIAHNTYEQFFESLELDRNYFFDKDYIIPIVNANADFHAPIKFGDSIICGIYVEKIGTTSFSLKYELLVNNTISAVIKTSHVLVKRKNFKKTNLPQNLKQKLTEHLF